MNPERGWYHADGDPEGTVRLWNGQEWVGFPQRDPRIELGETTTAAPFKPIRGQVQLKWLALPNQIMFGLVALGLLVSGLLLLSVALGLDNDSAADLVGLNGTTLEVQDAPAEEPGGFNPQFLLIGLFITLIPAVMFWAWFYSAYKNITRWHHAQYEPFWAIVAWFVPFINLRRPWRMMMELMERSPDREHEGAINPVLGFVWWFLWILPSVASNLLLSRSLSDPTALAQDPSVLAKPVLLVTAISLLLNALSTLCLVLLITQVTKYQDMRLRPSAAQRQAVQIEAENLAKFATPAAVEPRSFG